MFAFIFEFFAGHGLFLSCQDVFLDEAVNHEVGVSANGGSEMGIVRESESVMTDVIG